MNLSFSEIALILVIALVVIGPKKLPDVAKSVGKGYAEFKRTFNDFKKTVDITSPTTPTASKGNATPANSYKSRWEEQIVEPTPQAEPTVEVADVATSTESAEPVARAKRGDMVKEDNNDANG
ncbi:MAG: twin-arginine translocase TatA/TatE family subunit [Deferribacteraceae bacterium]|jgi:TatA/E family protein of Tat protein translocase|nr:twin-arginine translocase TatA/TatE family subunit [Deferribacteraceae bacterium]